MCVLLVSSASVPDTCHVFEEHAPMHSQVEHVSNGTTWTNRDMQRDVNVRWTDVDKPHLVELTTVTNCNALPQPGNELPQHEGTTIIDSMETSLSATLEKVYQQESEPHPTHGRATAIAKNDSSEGIETREQVFDLSSSASYGRRIPKNHDTAANEIHLQSCRKPLAHTTNNPMSATSKSLEKAPQKIVKSSEMWTSVDKTLVEDLFDQLLRSFDDVAITRPEMDRTGSDWSRDFSRRSYADHVMNDRLWQSVAYKWKSHILLRMRNQQVPKHALRRKRSYADMKLVQNPAF